MQFIARLSINGVPAEGTLRLSKVAQGLGVHPSTLRRWFHKGVGPPHIRTPGGTFLFRIEDVSAWQQSLASGGGVKFK